MPSRRMANSKHCFPSISISAIFISVPVCAALSVSLSVFPSSSSTSLSLFNLPSHCIMCSFLIFHPSRSHFFYTISKMNGIWWNGKRTLSWQKEEEGTREHRRTKKEHMQRERSKFRMIDTVNRTVKILIVINLGIVIWKVCNYIWLDKRRNSK